VAPVAMKAAVAGVGVIPVQLLPRARHLRNHGSRRLCSPSLQAASMIWMTTFRSEDRALLLDL